MLGVPFTVAILNILLNVDNVKAPSHLVSNSITLFL